MKLISIFIPVLIFANGSNESFLSDIEYGKMIYNNPRGIPCSKCHGNEGKGGHLIAKYYDKDSNPRVLRGNGILDYSFDDLKASLENRYRDKNNKIKKHRIMPVYYLTDKEINALFLYLKSVKHGRNKKR